MSEYVWKKVPNSTGFTVSPYEHDENYSIAEVASAGSLMMAILELSCTNPHMPNDTDRDWREYIIETHCVVWKIVGEFENGAFHVKEVYYASN
jgi:hypothetical protein